MKLTIIPTDGAVYQDSVVYLNLEWNGTPAGVHALQWQDIEGWIEYTDPNTPNETITSLPNWADNAMDAWNIANTPKPIPPITAVDNKLKASALLKETDWVTLPDVLDTTILPYLTNQAEYLVYRAALRVIVVEPIDGDMIFPVKPTSQWVK
jgi:hypothetical protein